MHAHTLKHSQEIRRTQGSVHVCQIEDLLSLKKENVN